jgi:hypothetical protein
VQANEQLGFKADAQLHLVQAHAGAIRRPKPAPDDQ